MPLFTPSMFLGAFFAIFWGRKGHKYIWLKCCRGFWLLLLLTKSKHFLSSKNVTSGGGRCFAGASASSGGMVVFCYHCSGAAVPDAGAASDLRASHPLPAPTLPSINTSSHFTRAQLVRGTISAQNRTLVNHILKVFYKPVHQVGKVHTGSIIHVWL